MSDVIVAHETRDLTELGGELSAWLASRLGHAQNLEIANLAYPRGAGQSHETILFDASWHADGRRHEQGFVVRIKPRGNVVYPDDLFEQQYHLMKVLHAHGAVRVARPMWLEEDPALLGAPFFIMEKKSGRVPVSIPSYAEVGWVADATPAQRARLWENGVRQLAAIQSVPLSSVSFLKGPQGASDGLEQEWDKYVRFAAWVSQERPWPVLDAALARLRERWPANQPPGLVWGDARLGNLMFDDDFDVVAVMDWEQPSLGGALHDLAWFVVLSDQRHTLKSGRHLEGMGTREETIALWRAVTGIPTDDFEWYEEFTALKLSCLSIRCAKLWGWPAPDEAGLARRMKVELAG